MNSNRAQPPEEAATSGAGTDRKFAVLTAVTLALIVYWSLYPFAWTAGPDIAGGFQILHDSYLLPPHRSDVVANVLLYIPFAFLAVQVWRRRPVFAFMTVLAGLALSTSVEIAQVYDQGRVTSIWDVCANTTGAFLGAAGGYVLHRQTTVGLPGQIARRPYVLMMLISWLGVRLFPYVPRADWRSYWHAVRPLIRSPQLPLPDLYRHTVLWLVAALLLQALAGARWSRLVFALFIPALVGARVVVGAPLSPAEVLGGGTALLLWVSGLWRLPKRGLILAWLLAGVVILLGLSPYHFEDTGRSFQWVPFRNLALGNVGIDIQNFLEKTFLFGTLVWLWVRSGVAWMTSTLACAAVVLSIGFLQVYLAGRSAGVTDTAILILTSLILRAMAEETPARADAAS